METWNPTSNANSKKYYGCKKSRFGIGSHILRENRYFLLFSDKRTERKKALLPYIHIGQLTISNYYLAMVLGYVFMNVLMLLQYRRAMYGLNPAKAILFATIVLILGILGCKILFTLENYKWIQAKGFTFGGFSFFGAVMLIPLLIPLFGKMMSLNPRASLDSSAICIIAMLGTIRIGCYLNGCCGGQIFSIGEFDFSFPTQLMECLCDFLILSDLLKKEKTGAFSGLLYPWFLFWYGIARFIIEFLRNTEKDWLFLSHAQWFSILAVIIGAVFVFGLKQNRRHQYS